MIVIISFVRQKYKMPCYAQQMNRTNKARQAATLKQDARQPVKLKAIKMIKHDNDKAKQYIYCVPKKLPHF